jgi:CRP-like cAMP-binding protein
LNEIRIKLERVDISQRVEADPLLKGSELVKLLGSDILKQGVAKRFGGRAALFRQNEPGESLFFVLSGDVRLYATQQTDGSELGTVAAGEVVGESELMTGLAPRCCSAIAHGDVDAVELPRAALVPHLKRLEPYLKRLHQARRAKLDEMNDFLNRW